MILQRLDKEALKACLQCLIGQEGIDPFHERGIGAFAGVVRKASGRGPKAQNCHERRKTEGGQKDTCG